MHNILRREPKKEVRLKVNFSRDLSLESKIELARDKVELDNVLQSRVFQYIQDWIKDEQEVAKNKMANTFDNEETNQYRIMYRMFKKFELQICAFYNACSLAEEAGSKEIQYE